MNTVFCGCKSWRRGAERTAVNTVVEFMGVQSTSDRGKKSGNLNFATNCHSASA